jgi:hypothetical protein
VVAANWCRRLWLLLLLALRQTEESCKCLMDV